MRYLPKPVTLPKPSLLGHEGAGATRQGLRAPSSLKAGYTSEPTWPLPAPGLGRASQLGPQLRVPPALQVKVGRTRRVSHRTLESQGWKGSQIM